MNVEEDNFEKEFERYISCNDTTEEEIREEIFEKVIQQNISGKRSLKKGSISTYERILILRA